MIQVWWLMLWVVLQGSAAARWSGVDGDRATRDAATTKN